MGIRKLQIQAYDAQLALAYALHNKAELVDEDDPVIVAWQEASRILGDMLMAGYAPRLWGVGLAAFRETGDETVAEIEKLDNIDWQ